MSIHLSGGGATQRRVVLSCDVPGCPVQVEPPPAERWRSDPDARAQARAQATGWTHDAGRGTDYCPQHAAHSVPPTVGTVPPRPTAAARDPRTGDPLDRDDYARLLRARLDAVAGPGAPGAAGGSGAALTAGQAEVMARLLEELAAVYRGEEFGALATELAAMLHAHRRGSARPGSASA